MARFELYVSSKAFGHAYPLSASLQVHHSLTSTTILIGTSQPWNLHLKQNLTKARENMKHDANLKEREREIHFDVGDMVLINCNHTVRVWLIVLHTNWANVILDLIRFSRRWEWDTKLILLVSMMPFKFQCLRSFMGYHRGPYAFATRDCSFPKWKDIFATAYPDFNLEDKVEVEGG